ncbi:BirA family transcriptional regulator, biotin operon repressor / biotin-[acetyl-CoA-carboxylase] ligase [Agromyces sp. CF514]|uniref:biotin--[acetyl-CoA-carboxylase] ligase n=1 Tax=Agromyces sp. CF514 TaxID=1881031 RepID=UPI0008E9D041|nr:biotin--[acetyl-CoA-carboxylase] ligase [Agromyces sp. CF514]SFR86234.1 BirA family transcriptional regulator, biotin operon repressor / biotin-[acetyl-CoA-carboxylase] ligase [Agromyces sp. CF514]
MDLPKSRAVAPRLEFLVTATSTNDALREAAGGADAAGWPHGSVLVTDDQTQGRGRLGRTWLAPTGKTLAISLLLRPQDVEGGPLPADAYGWIPLIAGAAMTEAVTRAVAAAAEASAPLADPDDRSGGVEVALKWPNDVLVSGYKVCGILSELLPESGAVVVGAGLNLTLDEHDLPTLTSTSLLLATGVAPDADAVLADYLSGFMRLFDAFVAAGGDAETSGVAPVVSALCGTLGSEVRVELPGDEELLGTAERLDSDGRLVVRDRENGEEQAVAAGDVTHLRY